MSSRRRPSPTRRRTPSGSGLRTRAYARDASPGRGGARTLAALDRWQQQYTTAQHADPLATMAAYSDWIRAEIRLVRKIWGAETPGVVAQMTDAMQRWALKIDQEIRAALEARQ